MEEKLWYKEGQKDNAVKMYLAGGCSQKDIGDIMGVSTTTVNRHFREVRRVFEEKGYQLITRDYKNTRQPLEYLCKKHLEKGILTSNYSDMKLGHGCKYCTNEERLGTYNTVSANRNKEEWSNTPANIYLIRCSSEDELFYKVGVTTTTANLRFNSSSKMPYDFEVICEAPTNLYQAILLEESILREVKKRPIQAQVTFWRLHRMFQTLQSKTNKKDDDKMSTYKFPMTLNKQYKEKLESLHRKYGTEMMEIEGMSPEQLDTCNFFKNFMETETVADATIDDNANVTNRNINTMLSESHKPFQKMLSRNKLYIEMREEFGKEVADEFLESVVNGELYEHDSHLSSYMPYCFAFSLKDIVHKGLFFLDEMKAGRPKHWDTFNHHVLEFISYATNQMAGATGIPDYLIYAYYFYKEDTKGMSPEDAKVYQNQKFQEFIYSLNQPYLKSGVQSAYTNVSILDYDHLFKFFASEKYPDGSEIIEHIDGIQDFQQDFLDYVGELRQEKWHTFPVISSSLIFKDGEYKDEKTAKMVVRHNWKYGFNDVNIMNVDEATSLASCCRLVSNVVELNKHKTFNSIGGSDVDIGSTKVVTLNLVRLALLSETEGDFLELVKEKTELIHKYHFAHRRTLQKLIDKGLLPLYTHGLMSFEDQFATVGINGVYEAMSVMGGISEDKQGVYYDANGMSLAEDMFNVITKSNESTIEEYGYMSNVEQVPAESTAVKLAAKDRIYFGNRYINKELGEDNYIYGNQWIPLKEETSIFHRIDSAKLDEHCGGGAILHINLGENFNSFEDAWEFTQSLANKGVGYFSYISLIDICDEDHSFFGKVCPVCGEPATSKGIKIVGYLVKQDSYKKERKQELDERKFYNL